MDEYSELLADLKLLSEALGGHCERTGDVTGVDGFGRDEDVHGGVAGHMEATINHDEEAIRPYEHGGTSDREEDAEESQSSAGATLTGAGSTPHSTSVGAIPLTSESPMTPIMPASADPGIVPQLHNVVSTVNLGCKLDLRKIAMNACNTEYNPKRFAAVVMRIREPRTTALIFSSGKMVCTGAKSEEQSRLASRKYARIIQKLGFEAKFLGFKIQNMVATGDVRFAINLEGLAVAHRRFSSYEPELSHSVVYHMVKPRIILLISVSGKVTLTGAKLRSQIYEAFNNINTILKGYRKQ